MKKLLNNCNQIYKKSLKALIAICLTLPFALLICILSLSIMGNPYSLRDVLLFTPIFAFFLFWIILLIVNKYLLLRSSLQAKNPEKPVHKRSLIFVLIPFLLFISLFTWILFSVEDTQGISYFPPNYKYQLKIYPASNNSGEICIDEIQNSRGAVFNFNDAVQDFRITGNWEKDVNGCLFYLANGDQGDINVDYVGPIDAILNFDFRIGPGGGIVNISSNPGGESKLNLSSENNSLMSLKFKLGTHLIRNITDWGVLAGLFSAIIIFLMIINLIEKKWVEKTSGKPVSTLALIQKFKVILSQPISEKSAILILFIIYFFAVILTIFITRPLAFGPSHFGDEIIYWETALSLYDGSYSPSQYHIAPPFYPISILPSFYLFYPEYAYLGAKILNAIYFTSAIFPAFLLLRIFLNGKKSILIASLLLLNPAQIIFPGRILSENLFFPMLLWAFLLGFKTFDQPEKRKHLMSFLFGVVLSLLYLTRYIGLALIPALFIAWWLKPEKGAVLDLNTLFKKRIKAFMWVLFPMGLILGTWIVSGMMDGLSTTESIGVRFSANPRPWLTMNRFLMWGVFYAKYTILLAAPFIPILLSSILDFKNLDEERKRWFATLLFVILITLIVCIRHSWRSGYNYPVPWKIQGRYIFFFNHLFLMTSAILFFREPDLIKRVKSFVFSCFLVSLAYAIIHIGFIFMDQPLRASVSSPYGRFMDAYGPGFLTFSLIIFLLISFLPFMKKSLSTTLAFLSILGFYILGGMKVYKIETTDYSQLFNSQIYYLLNEGISQCENYSKESKDIIEIYYPENTIDWKIRYWRGTLDFYGLTSAKLYAENIPVNSTDDVFRVEYGNCRINLRSLNQEQFQMSHNPKFSYGSEYLDYQKEE